MSDPRNRQPNQEEHPHIQPGSGSSQPTSVQEQVAREIMARPARPDEESKQTYPGR
ncbi:hypothetical protein [Staphylospora marina]|uniref:hypothetical protein n=1 Tax=Staphylospora marina TaxID=2490858 RepID=UPI0013DDE0F9|nr:hypothetical protein [Staphylospora marina]